MHWEFKELECTLLNLKDLKNIKKNAKKNFEIFFLGQKKTFLFEKSFKKHKKRDNDV